MDFLKGLNPQQLEAVETTDGPVLILAGAGSGKTKVITQRIAHLITAKHVPPFSILAVTFTNKAAGEMRNRVFNLLEGYDLTSNPQLATFHSFCVRLLRRDGDALGAIRPGFTKTFTIYDADDQLSIIKSAYRRMGLDDKALPHRATQSAISHSKSQKIGPDEMAANAKDPKATRIAAVYAEYETALLKTFDFAAKHLADPKDGIWIDSTTADGQPKSTGKAHAWKANYHDVRALVKFIDAFGVAAK